MKKVVSIFIILVTLVIFIFDVYLWGLDQTTISQVVIAWSSTFSIITFAWGFLMGHWFG